MNQQREYFQDVDTHDEYAPRGAGVDGSASPSPKAGTLNKQFQPKKLKDANKLWNKESEQQMYSYTAPNKASTLSNSTPKGNREPSLHSGTLRPPKTNPFVYDPPTTHSTPKLPRVQRPESAAPVPTMSREQKLTWGPRGAVPHPQHFRSASAMGASLSRPPPMHRPNEFVAPMGQYVGSRYQSYCTLPRPEHMDPEFFNQVHACPFDPKVPPMSARSSRAPSAVPPPLPLASNLASFAPQPQTPSPRTIAALAMTPSVINWNRMSLISCMQVLCCLAIFGVGVTRMMMGARWAVGIELLFATGAVVPALVGMYAAKRGNFSAAIFCYFANLIECFFASVPFIIGLLPALKWVFPRVEERWLVSSTEPVHLDFALSLLVAVQVLMAFLMCLSGCVAGGRLFASVEDLKLQHNVKAAFDDVDGAIPYKN